MGNDDEKGTRLWLKDIGERFCRETANEVKHLIQEGKNIVMAFVEEQPSLGWVEQEIKEELTEDTSTFKEAEKRPEQKEERELGEKIWEDIKDLQP